MSLKKTVAGAVVVILTGCGGSPGEESRSDPGNGALVATGAKVYAQQCAACHGAKLEGQPNWRKRLSNGRFPAPPHDESGHTWHHPDDVLFGTVKHGLVPGIYAPPGYESDMPAFGGKLTDEEIWAVLAFIKSHWKSQDVLEARAEIVRNSKSK